jgi:hypothetical protein
MAEPSQKTEHSHIVFTAIVETSVAGAGTVTIVREASGTVRSTDSGFKMQGIMVSSSLASYFGFKECSLPQPGSRVLCAEYSASHCYILGVIPNQALYGDGLPSRAMLGAGSALQDQANRMGMTDRIASVTDSSKPGDVVDGEYVIANEFGVLLGLYQQLANLKASELAQVQCYLLDDLVRIISHNFQHYTALGEYNIYHDGKRLMAEFGATHKTVESYGIPATQSDAGQGGPTFIDVGTANNKDDPDYYKIQDDERIKAIERFKIFLGSVGDFLHIFLCKPDDNEKRYLAADKPVNKPDSGLCDFHIGTDGGLHMRSVKEIFIEKSNWIRVPIRQAAPDDPQGDDAEILDYEKKQKYEFSKNFKFKGNPFNYSQQIRDYVAYVNEKLGYQNFKKHQKDFYVSDNIQQETPLDAINNIDQETSSDLKEYKLKTAGIYLMPNGGITIRDAWNSAIVMEGGNISLQPAKDLFLQPLRSIVGKAGAHINLAAKKQVDLSTTEESIRIKSKKGQHFYSHESGIVIESESEKEETGELDSEKALEKMTGIVLKSKSSIFLGADKNIVSHSKEKTLFKSMKETYLISQELAFFYTLKDFIFVADSQILATGEKGISLLSPAQALLAGAGNTVLGQKGQPIAVESESSIKGVVKVNEELKKMKLDSTKGDVKDIWKFTKFTSLEKFDLVKFRFLAKDRYGSINPQEDAIPSTLAQQDDLLTGIYGLDTWQEEYINGTLPYPSADLFSNFYYNADAPKNLTTSNTSTDYANKGNPSSSGATISLDSLQQYKIYKV